MKNWIGKTIIGIGLIHTAFGMVVFWSIFAEILNEGLFNTVNQQPIREAFYWFEFFGLVLMILGALINWMEFKQEAIPGFLKWSLLGMSAVMVFIQPVTGAWLMAIPLFGMFWTQGSI
ncbi:MAG: DUF6463 family protein [Bacteroidia bacterium]|nr:DUF6463 family protein [Bacteroidia bacterium]